jgi:cell division protein FtsB
VSPLSNAERQARWRDNRAAEIAALKAEVVALKAEIAKLERKHRGQEIPQRSADEEYR